MSESLKTLEAVCNALLAKKDLLNELDAVMGDGEHGSNIERTFGQVLKSIPDMQDLSDLEILDRTGTILLAAGGGTATTLMGFAARKMAVLLKNADEITPDATEAVMTKAWESIQKKSKAEIGDKTLMDAYTPAVRAYAEAIREGKDYAAAFSGAADAAEAGAEATKAMIAMRGRGYYVGERGIGTPDPGATSVATIFRAIADSLADTNKK